MPDNISPQKFVSYDTSPLGVFLHDFLKELKKIKKTYPSIKNDRGSTYIKLIEIFTDLVHSNLSSFSRGKVPEALRLSGAAVSFAASYQYSIAPLIQSLAPEDLFYLKCIDFCAQLLPMSNENMLDFHTIKVMLELQKAEFFQFENANIKLNKSLTPNEKDALVNSMMQKIESHRQLDEDQSHIDTTLLFIDLFLDRIPKDPAFFALLEVLTTLLAKLPEEFPQLVPFLTPQFLPLLFKSLSSLTATITMLLDLFTTQKVDNFIENIEVLSEKKYQYKVIYKQKDINDDIVDFYEDYRLTNQMIPLVLSMWRRYYLLKLAKKDEQCERRMALFQQIEQQEIVKNTLLQQQVMQKQHEMQEELEAVVAPLLDFSLPVNIENIKTYLSTYQLLSAYLKKHSENTLKQFPLAIPTSNISELKCFIPEKELSRCICNAQRHQDTLAARIKEKYGIDDFVTLDLDKSDTQKNIEYKIAHNNDMLQKLRALQENTSKDKDNIFAYLQMLNLDSKEKQDIDACFTIFYSNDYEKKESEFINALTHLNARRDEYLRIEQLSKLSPAALKAECEAVEKHIAELESSKPSNIDVLKQTIRKINDTVSANHANVSRSVFRGITRGLSRFKRTVSFTEAQKEPVAIEKVAEQDEATTTGVSKGVFRGITRRLSRVKSVFRRTEPTKESVVIQKNEEKNEAVTTTHSTRELADPLLQVLQHQKTALDYLYRLSLVFNRIEQQANKISSNILPKMEKLDLIYQADQELLNIIKEINSAEYQQFLEALRQQHQLLADSTKYPAVLKLLKQQYQLLIDTKKHILVIDNIQKQHQASMEKLVAWFCKLAMNQYTALDQQHTQMLMEYSELRTKMLQKNVDVYSQQIKEICDKTQHFEALLSNMRRYFEHPLLAESLKTNISSLALPFSVQTLQAMASRHQMIAARIQLLINATPSSSRYSMSQLQTQLAHYIETGNNLDAIIQWMDVNQPAVRHVRFKTIWHQTHIDFWDKKYDSRAYILSDPSVTDGHPELVLADKYKSELEHLQKNNPPCAQLLNNLMQILIDMRHMPHLNTDEKEAISTFTYACMQDLAMFVDNKISFEHFQKKFLTRLHSQDELMQQKNTQEIWRYWVANLLIGLLTVGIALAAQWTYTRVSEGRGTLFFAKTQKEQYIQNMERHLQNGMKP